MPLTDDDRIFLKRLYQSMDPNKALEPDDPFYEPIYEIPGCTDPVQLLYSGIDFADTESCQFFSGFRGSGKTTELKRLRRKLEEHDYLVFYADALEYVNPAEMIDISDLLIVLAGAFSDAIEKQLGADIKMTHESYWTRFWHYLNTTSVTMDEIKLTPVKDVAELKFALKDTPSFRQKVQQMMSTRLFELEAQVKKFFEDSVKAIREQRPGQKIVFLFDQLEQIRGSLFNEREVISSVERLFRLHIDRLKLPYIHTVYTVPPWLKFVYPTIDVVILHTVRQWCKDQARNDHAPGNACLSRVVNRRFQAGGLRRLFGEENRADQFTSLCGGHFRDLLRLFRGAIQRAQSLPISDEVIHSSIVDVRSTFLPIAYDDAIWLGKIADSRASGLPDTSPDSVSRFTRFLDTHFVLYLRNGEEWYDIHPLIRDEVDRIVKSSASSQLSLQIS
jgi:hypothetical protein